MQRYSSVCLASKAPLHFKHQGLPITPAWSTLSSCLPQHWREISPCIEFSLHILKVSNPYWPTSFSSLSQEILHAAKASWQNHSALLLVSLPMTIWLMLFPWPECFLFVAAKYPQKQMTFYTSYVSTSQGNMSCKGKWHEHQMSHGTESPLKWQDQSVSQPGLWDLLPSISPGSRDHIVFFSL